jgi:hypothetical protein
LTFLIRPNLDSRGFDLPRQRVFVDKVLGVETDGRDATKNVVSAPACPQILIRIHKYFVFKKWPDPFWEKIVLLKKS